MVGDPGGDGGGMAAGEAELALSIDNLSKRFGGLTAVNHLDLEVAYGEAFALVGPDAAGKTTTMRMLVGIMDPDQGRAEVLGFDTVKDDGAPQGADRLHAPALRPL